MKTALLISTYNWTEALAIVFESILNQSIFPNEIIIADDGSTEDTKKLIDSFRDKIKIPIQHVWHEDKGFRRAMILNKAMAKCKSDYIIQVDGDCILHKKFIEDHIKTATPDTFLYGTRAYITKEHNKIVLQEKIIHFQFLSKMLKGITRNIRIPIIDNISQKRRIFFTKKVRGCNMSFWRKDILDINGYDENFEGWGCEDQDIGLRLTNNQIYSRRLRYKAILYHIWHPLASKNNYNQQKEMIQHIRNNKIIKCDNGINKYL